MTACVRDQGWEVPTKYGIFPGHQLGSWAVVLLGSLGNKWQVGSWNEFGCLPGFTGSTGSTALTTPADSDF